MFLTGIESSDPMIDGVRRDQLREAHDFTVHGHTRLQNIRRLGIRWLRFGPPYSGVHLGPNAFDWRTWDFTVEACSRLGLHIIADLVHFGLPDWLHAGTPSHAYWQNPSMPEQVATYAEALVRRYPDVRCFTPVNEPFVTAWMSARLGVWNEQISRPWTDDHAFVRAAANAARAMIVIRQAIRRAWRETQRPGAPVFVQNESFEEAIAGPGSGRLEEVRRFNLARFVALDLAFGHDDPQLRDYVLGEGLPAEEYAWFMEQGDTEGVLLGIDHYPACVHTYERDRIVHHDASSPSHLVPLVRLYADRYGMADRLVHTEVNGPPGNATMLCQRTYDELVALRSLGYRIGGMTWYGDEVQIGWQDLLTGPNAHAEYPVGLFHHGHAQPVARLFRTLARRGFPSQTEGDRALAA
jgi:hypothetical protein